MRPGFRKHLSFANVTAVVALFVALGGVSYAVISLPKNSVGQRQIEPEAVGAAEIRRAAVRSPEVRNRSLRARDFDIDEFPEGPPGPIGPPGLPGADATKLFAYIREPVPAGPPVVQYGSGVSGVRRVGPGSYVVTFVRSLENCVVHANSGVGDPHGDTGTIRSVPEVLMGADDHRGVLLNWVTLSQQAQNTSFLISAFC